MKRWKKHRGMEWQIDKLQGATIQDVWINQSKDNIKTNLQEELCRVSRHEKSK